MPRLGTSTGNDKPNLRKGLFARAEEGLGDLGKGAQEHPVLGCELGSSESTGVSSVNVLPLRVSNKIIIKCQGGRCPATHSRGDRLCDKGPPGGQTERAVKDPAVRQQSSGLILVVGRGRRVVQRSGHCCGALSPARGVAVSGRMPRLP